MARIARYVVPGLPQHVTQRGNRRAKVFFRDADYELYRDLLAMQCRKHGVAVWGYCLMPTTCTSSSRPRPPRRWDGHWSYGVRVTTYGVTSYGDTLLNPQRRLSSSLP